MRRPRIARAAGGLALAFAVFAPRPGLAAGTPDAHDSLQERIIAVSKAVKPSVVHVQAILRINDRRNEVTGSGVIASADGLVLTNQHVVERAEKVEVSVPGQKKPLPAKVLGTDKQTDLAVLRVESPRPLPAAHFGTVKDVRVGQWVLAIGNPYGLDGTVSLGIVSAKGRNLEIPDLINDFIQTDAMIDRGSSGGPLVDLEGRVIGINSRGQGRGIGFTIPVDTVLQVMEQLRAGRVERGWLGITIQPLDRDLASYLKVPDATGVIVNSVTSDSPAERAGLRTGDIVTAVGGRNVEAEKEEDLGAFQREVASHAPGEKVALTVIRNGRKKQLRATLGPQPAVEPKEAESDLGFHVQEITEGLFRSERLSSRAGAYVSFVARGSPAAEAGLEPGDVVVQLGGHDVRDLASFKQAAAAAAKDERVLLHAQRGSDLRFVLIQRSARPAEDTPAEEAPGRASLPAPPPGAPPRSRPAPGP